ncbi:hypothetical protein KOR42_22320 [Thalassoglobus neptunius]|uniref:Putative Flp pilus-assembly TadG-like N-terminal domain-containing protein n=1 Tax=Thalassoglobus neptunius TaxID=1938619 RepID=A0A5C5X9K7_9PLAN|nr:Tad domain-containing protein [Thalassoglobus neptunius]TWT58845.1 hypothetical protein KOR42_22320 [Thalassoglobus neptunius]
MIWFAVLLFALLPLMALVIHLGMVTLSRRQMQTAVDAAAMEGLRLRDRSLVAPTFTESDRRAHVTELVTAIYDDNLSSDADDAMQFGAGPVILFDDDATDVTLPGTSFRASRSIRRENTGVYDPVLQSNESNERHGDMVAGQFQPAASHSEDATYSREDFLLSGDSGYDSVVGDDSFLVRLRRTDPTVDPAPAIDTTAGVSSSGPTVPFLFGRGPYGGPDLLDRRERGTIVRATAIAQAVPAMTVGPYLLAQPPGQPDPVPGLAPIQLELASWNLLVLNVPTMVSVSGSNVSGGVTGEFVDPQVATVGDELISGPAQSVVGERFVAIYAELPSGARLVAGFGTVDVDLTLTGGTITKLPSRIGAANSSATWRWPQSLANLTPDDLAAFLSLRETLQEGLMAPALRRSLH